MEVSGCIIAPHPAVHNDARRIPISRVLGAARREGYLGGKTGSVTVVQRESCDLGLNPQHAVFRDSTRYEQEAARLLDGRGLEEVSGWLDGRQG
jgi:hypothetical protein